MAQFLHDYWLFIAVPILTLVLFFAGRSFLDSWMKKHDKEDTLDFDKKD